MRIACGVVATVALTCCCVAPVAGQVSIHVADSDGSPIAAVRVDVFGLGELIGSESTSAQGIAELSFERWSEARRISLSHVGFQTLVVQVEDIPDDGVILLAPDATEIEGLTVEAPDLCPVVDDPRARRLWAQVAAGYARDTGSRAYLGYFSAYSGTVRSDPLNGVADSMSAGWITAGDPYVRHGGDHTARSLEECVSAEGYAWPPLVIGGMVAGRARAWAYPQFDRIHAYHFASPLFGALHDFAVGIESEEQTTLVFCDNGEGTGATIQGVISLEPDEAFLAAEWRFETSDPDEGAGGSVSFMSYVESTSGTTHLVASRGIYFRDRHIGNNVPYPDLQRTYSRSVTTKLRWYLLPSLDHPCNDGLSYYQDPPRDPQGVRFAECVAEYWGRK